MNVIFGLALVDFSVHSVNDQARICAHVHTDMYSYVQIHACLCIRCELFVCLFVVFSFCGGPHLYCSVFVICFDFGIGAFDVGVLGLFAFVQGLLDSNKLTRNALV